MSEKTETVVTGIAILILYASVFLAFSSMVSCEIQKEKLECLKETKLEACLK